MTEPVFRSDLPVDLLDHMGTDLDVACAAWVSTNQDMAQAGETPISRVSGLIDYLVRNRHASPLEHCVMRLRVEAPIFVFREWHRHRTQSYNEMSGRYTELPGEFYVLPPGRPMRQVGKPGAYQFIADEPLRVRSNARKVRAYRTAWELYQEDLAEGAAKEVARMHLGVGIYSHMWATASLRNWLGFLSLRTAYDAEDALFPSTPQWEIARCADQVEAHVARLFPLTHRSWVDAKRYPI